MPTNKNALLRYKTIDNCLKNRYRQWTLSDLVEACSDALYEFTGKDENISSRTIQLDIQKMRSDELGYNAPIVVRNKKYYTYEDPNYSITNTPLTNTDLKQMRNAVDILKQFSGFSHFAGVEDIISRLEDHVNVARHKQESFIHIDTNNHLKGLNHIATIYDAIAAKTPITIIYKSFKSHVEHTYVFSPYILKEYNNRWFVIGKHKLSRHIATFALDRILEIHSTQNENFIYSNNFDPNKYFDDIIGVTKIPNKSDKPQIVRFWAAPNCAPYIETKPFHHSQMIAERCEDGSVIFQLHVCVNFELEKILLEHGNWVKVLAPTSLAQQIKSRLKQALELYK